ncbi:MAG: hypothetical protein KBH06_06925 [Spirochaetes bacterium]|nr:hypothetical protein [Spirochaetota bacterium]
MDYKIKKILFLVVVLMSCIGAKSMTEKEAFEYYFCKTVHYPDMWIIDNSQNRFSEATKIKNSSRRFCIVFDDQWKKFTLIAVNRKKYQGFVEVKGNNKFEMKINGVTLYGDVTILPEQLPPIIAKDKQNIDTKIEEYEAMLYLDEQHKKRISLVFPFVNSMAQLGNVGKYNYNVDDCLKFMEKQIQTDNMLDNADVPLP